MDTPERDPKDPSQISNDDGLSVSQIIGRCSKCHLHGTIDARKTQLAPNVIDAILAYKIVPRIYCMVCKKPTEFIPTEVKKYKDVGMLKNMQTQVVGGIAPLSGGLVDADGNPLN